MPKWKKIIFKKNFCPITDFSLVFQDNSLYYLHSFKKYFTYLIFINQLKLFQKFEIK